uniref:RNA-directed DNA polymerase, eukaryota n=1 Tax=Tanacetum cinerariifolium TaxID=118510 RepID=A0A6L2LAW4_TANCI|nr:RNA-directed DNA polymerase, eukaryota [Tanacetum cinerariifolium]
MFDKYKKNDIHRFSLVHEISKLIEVGGALGYDVWGWRRALEKMTRKTGESIHQNRKFIICGDLNKVRTDYECFGSTFSNFKAQIFNSFIDAAGLIEIPMGGRLFTWMNKPGTKLSKLDRLLMSEDVLVTNPDLKAISLDRLWSDHNPILLHADKSDFGPIPFKLFHSWMQMPDFDIMIKESCDEFNNLNSGLSSSLHKRLIKIESSTAFDEDRNYRLQLMKEQDDLYIYTTMDISQKPDFTGIKEIRNAVWACGIDKSSGPDGFSFLFLKKYWDYFKGDVEKFVLDFMETDSLSRGTNSAFITLIPKVPNLLLIKNYCPISLIGMQYKIIANLLPIHLAKVLDNIVSPVQSVFISSRQILDGPLMVSEIIEWYKKKNKKLMIFKVDFEKAFDSVSWNYLDFVLLHMGFGSKWRSWIRSCLHSACTSILINGSPALEFSMGRGLRQGDPLSPFLFILVIEGLHLSLQEANHSRLIKGVSLINDVFNVSYLFFADDVDILTDWNTNDMENIVQTLNSFYMASRIKINIAKSNVYGVGVSKENLEAMETLTKCLAGSLPFTYLGLPIAKNMKLTDSWCVMVEKFKSKLSSWKANLLSIGGRLTLIKSVRIIKAVHGMEAGLDEKGCYTKGIWAQIVGSSNYLHSRNILSKGTLWRLITSGRTSNLLHILMHELRYVALLANSNSWTWSVREDAVFSVAATRLHIDHTILPSLTIKTRWKKGLPRKYKYHSYHVLRGIYAAGSENHPPMLKKDNYIPWSSRLLRVQRENGPFVRRMILEPGDPDCEVPVAETFHELTDEELSKKDIKQMEDDDQAIQTILMGSDIGDQEKKAKLFNEWKRFTSTDGESIESYYHHFSKLMNDFKRNKHFLEKIASNLKFLSGYEYRSSQRNANGRNHFRHYVKQNVRNQTGYNAWQIIGNPNGIQNGLIVVLEIVNQNVNQNMNGNVVAIWAVGNDNENNGNQIRCYNYRGVGHYARNCTVRPKRRDATYLQTQLLFAQKEEAGIQLQVKEFDLMDAATEIEEIKEVNANYILMANLQQASSLSTQVDNAPYADLLEYTSEPHLVQHDDSNVVHANPNMEHSGEIVEQHPVTVEETRAYFESLYNNFAMEVEKVNTANHNKRKE